MKKSLYIHIPFCRKKCPYCDFYSRFYDKALAKAYIEVLCRQIKALDWDFSTVYIGGGTPSVLSLGLLKKLLKALSKVSAKAEEFTVEVNPESLDKKKLELFRDNRVNRLSIGLQSFSDKKLRKLGRVHNSKKAIEAIQLARKAGFKDIGIDLIFGVSEETLSDWALELKQAACLGLKHISTYCLTCEKNTPLFLQVKKKFTIPLGDEVLAKMYIKAINYLSKKGFKHYEISNFAKPGFESKHNQSYWQGNPYLGLGPSAVSFINARREKNVSNVVEYIDKVEKGESPVCFSEILSKPKQAKELAAIKIRTKEGINFEWFKAHTGYDFLKLE
ncbi:MAG: radical SAM family heme chaperone HemW, partial [Candidatus Omnitrophica bacterium]|nr:radical SAM family heme chaperone HemW [Candidatus Omnitrophota bacterium]